MRSFLSILSIVFVLSACATAHTISRVQLGMTKDEVVKLMGKPASVSAQGDFEYLNFALSETDDQAFVGVTVPGDVPESVERVR